MAGFYLDKGEEKVSFQEYKKEGNTQFVEVLSGMLYLPREQRKIILNFNVRDSKAPEGSKIKATIPIYLKETEALALAKFIMYGGIERKKYSNMQQFPEEDAKRKILFTSQGGTNVANLIKMKKPRKDGKCEARIFTIEVGDRKEFILKAVVGPGRVKLTNGQFDDRPNAKGLYVLCGKQDFYISIGFDTMELLELASEIEMKILSMRVLEESKFQTKLRKYYEQKGKKKEDIHF